MIEPNEPPRPTNGSANAEVPLIPAGTETYAVGYCKPPKATRFKPGKSGNPKGGKRREPSVSEQVDQILRRKVTVSEGGKPRLLTLQEVALRSLAASAAKGDFKAFRFLLDLRDSHKDDRSADIDAAKLSQDNQAVLADLVRQLQTGEPIAPVSGISAGSTPIVSAGGEELFAPAPSKEQPVVSAEPPLFATRFAADDRGPQPAEAVTTPVAPARDPVNETSRPPNSGPQPSQGAPSTPTIELPPVVPNWQNPAAGVHQPVRAGGAPDASKALPSITLVNPPPAPVVNIIRSAPMPPMRRGVDDEGA